MTYMNKSLYDISWKITEEEYRADPALSYSTLAKYERSGFNDLDTLFDKVESPSLTFGSAVDSIITGGMDEFNNRFIIASFPPISSALSTIVKDIFTIYSNEYSSLNDIPDNIVIGVTDKYAFQLNWKPETRARVVKEKCSEYYKLLYLAKDKTLISEDLYKDILNTVEVLKTSEATSYYFQEDNPFNEIERLYQLKFKTVLNNVEYRCMMDLAVVDHKNKTIQPIDLKTSSKKEWDFYKSFLEWSYQIQARLYWRILRAVMDEDEYFKEFTLLPYKFIVANRVTLTPLVWLFEQTANYGSLILGKTRQIILRDPEEIGKELTYYLKYKPKVPKGISECLSNNITEWIDRNI